MVIAKVLVWLLGKGGLPKSVLRSQTGARQGVGVGLFLALQTKQKQPRRAGRYSRQGRRRLAATFGLLLPAATAIGRGVVSLACGK